MITYSKTSPYSATLKDKGYLDIWGNRSIPTESDDILYTVPKNYEHRPDLLAYNLYQDVNLWWVFAVRNRSVLKDPIYDLNAGIKIYLPKLTTLKTVLGF